MQEGMEECRNAGMQERLSPFYSTHCLLFLYHQKKTSSLNKLERSKKWV